MPTPSVFGIGNIDPACQLAIKWQMLCSNLSKAALWKTVAEAGVEVPYFPYDQRGLWDHVLGEGVVAQLIVQPSVITTGSSYCIVTG